MTTTKSTPQDGLYISEIKNPHDLTSFRKVSISFSAPQQDRNMQRVLYTNGTGRKRIRNSTPAELVELAADDFKNNVPAICVVEDISPAFEKILKDAWKLDAEFFDRHRKDPSGDLWSKQRPNDLNDNNEYRNLVGAFEYHGIKKHTDLQPRSNHSSRHCFQELPYPVSSSTVISYYRVKSLYLILVDAPLHVTSNSVRSYRTTLRLSYATNRGGILLPPLFSDDEYSLFSLLDVVFKYDWHLNLFFDPKTGFDPKTRGAAIPSQPFLYTLSASLWQSNISYLREDIHRITFEGVRDLNKINEVLHSRRENVNFLKTTLTETCGHVPKGVDAHFQNLDYYRINPEDVEDTGPPRTPIIRHQRLLVEAEQLEAFVMQTFPFLMSSVAIEQTRLTIEQSDRGIRLTQLAFIYVPLSFITSVYGMNLKELNASGPSIWVCFVSLAVVAALTASIFWLLQMHRDWRRKYSEASTSLC